MPTASRSASENKAVFRDVPAAPRARLRAAKVPNPRVCGCGRRVAFDVLAKFFFCIGCGQTEECVCRQNVLTSVVRPVRVG